MGYYGAKITSADESSNKEADSDDEDIFIDQRHAIQVQKFSSCCIKHFETLCRRYVKEVKFSLGCVWVCVLPEPSELSIRAMLFIQ